jgi:DNA polymerase-1
LLQKYDTLEGVYEHLPEIKEGVREKLIKDRDQAFFCERMARLVCLPLKRTLEDIAIKNLAIAPAKAALRELEFMSLLNRLENIAKSPYGQKAFLHDDTPAPVPVKEEKAQMTLF